MEDLRPRGESVGLSVYDLGSILDFKQVFQFDSPQISNFLQFV
jgi:hypothetical protein